MKRQRFLFLVMLVILVSCFASAQQFGPWSAPVNVGPPVNTVNTDYQPFLSKDGLSLYFVYLPSNVGTGAQYIAVAKRSSVDAAWGAPQILGPEINAVARAGQPFVTVDGHYLYFNTARPGGFGRADIHVSRRQNKREDFGPGGWQAAVNLGPGVNSSAIDQAPFVVEDENTGDTYLYFNSDRSGNHDLYVSTLQPDGTFGAAVPVPELVPGTVNSPDIEQHVTLSRDGLEMYFISNRPGSAIHPPTDFGPGGDLSHDIWVSRRASTSEPWGVPENLDWVNAELGGPRVNSDYHDGRPSLSFDGTNLYFFSAFRAGNQSAFFDLWVATREKLTGPSNE